MNLRAPLYSDHGWMTAAYKTWPKGIMTDYDVKLLLTRWIERGQPICRVAEVDGEPVGLITYDLQLFQLYVYNVLVVPEQRQKGYFKQIAQLVRDEVEPLGVIVAKFTTLPGPIENRYPDDTIVIGDPL